MAVQRADVSSHSWSYEDYYALEDGARYEVLEGDLLQMPAPETSHQTASRDLGTSLWAHVRERNLGEVFWAPIDVVLSKHTVLQPDVLFVSTEHADRIRRRGVFGAPDLVIEILSPSTALKDRNRKRELYEKHGVPELWLVDPAHRIIEVFGRAETRERYALISGAAESGSVTSNIVPEWSFDVAALPGFTPEVS